MHNSSWGLRASARRLAVLAGLVSASSWAQTIPVVPLPKATGKSTIEQRYVYAKPDKGEFEMNLIHGGAAPTEVVVQEPMMCQPQAKAKAKIKYDKSKNEVKLIVDFHKALPYRMSYTRPADVSTPYNQFPVSITDAHWQMWFVGRMFTFDTTFYYSATTLQLIGHEEQFPGGPPPNSIPVSVPTMQMIGTPIFEGQPNGNAHVEFNFRYDMILDDRNAGGTLVAFLPYNLCKPDEYGPWYLNGGLPASKAMNFDQVLESIWSGYGIAISSSLEPAVKPSYLDSRDNTMIAWGQAYPGQVAAGMNVDAVGGYFTPPLGCPGTRVNPGFPSAYFNICGP